MILKNVDKNSYFANFFEQLTVCFGDLKVFERKIEQIAHIAHLPLTEFEIDHLAVRMNSVEIAHQWKTLLSQRAELLKESEVNGRPISLFTLQQPLLFCRQAVSIIELPFPKGKIYPQEGWEHIEIVMPFKENESVAQWCERICEQFQWKNNPELRVKISQPQVVGEKLANPTIALQLAKGTLQNYCCLKVHPYGIKTVVDSELSY